MLLPNLPSQKQLLSPQSLFKSLLQEDYSAIQCLQSLPEDKVNLVEQKMRLKQQITVLQKSKSEYMKLLQQKQKVKGQLKQLLNYRESIDYDHKYKSIKFDHYNFPYRDNSNIKEQLNTFRMQNLQKKRKIKEFEEAVKRKQREIEQKRIQKQNLLLTNYRDSQPLHEDINRHENFWPARIENIKHRYLSQDQQFKRAKIRHDYNLLVERQCGCKPNITCGICSHLNLQQKTSYSQEALLSPRYRSIYNRRF